jgi:hypothetical protein
MTNRIQVSLIFTLLLCLCLPGRSAAGDFIVSHRATAGGVDKRDEYTVALIHLALEKTKATYGPYQMRSIPGNYYNLRARIATSNNQFPNMLLEESYDDDYISKSKLDLTSLSNLAYWVIASAL